MHTSLFDQQNKGPQYIINIETMCGNELSSITEPQGGWRTQISSQVASGKIKFSNYRVSMADALSLRGLNTQNVKEIELTKCQIDHQILQQLLKNDLSNLQKLSLNNNKIGPIGCRNLASSESLRNLKSLQLNGNKIKDPGVKALSTGYFSELQDISLNDNGLTIDGVSTLQSFSGILFLALSGNKLNDSGTKAIKSINPQGLVFLCLSRNDFTDKSVEEFFDLEELNVLMLDRNKIRKNKSQLDIPSDLFLFY